MHLHPAAQIIRQIDVEPGELAVGKGHVPGRERAFDADAHIGPILCDGGRGEQRGDGGGEKRTADHQFPPGSGGCTSSGIGLLERPAGAAAGDDRPSPRRSARARAAARRRSRPCLSRRAPCPLCAAGRLALRDDLPGMAGRADGMVAPRICTVGTTQLTVPTSVDPTSVPSPLSGGKIASHSARPSRQGRPKRAKARLMSSSVSVAWICAAKARSASSNGGGPSRSSSRCIELLERRVADEIGIAADDLAAHAGLRHQRGALGDLARRAGDSAVQLGQRRGRGSDSARRRAPARHSARCRPHRSWRNGCARCSACARACS